MEDAQEEEIARARGRAVIAIQRAIDRASPRDRADLENLWDNGREIFAPRVYETSSRRVQT
jgi:hypothetical protein